MDINIFLKIGFEPTALALLERVFGAAAPKVEAAAPRVVPPVAAVEAEVAASKTAEASKAAKATDDKYDKPKADHKQVIFDAIDRARKRIEGEDWETNPQSERRARYHAALSAKLKEVAARLAKSYPEFNGEVTKPSELAPYMAEAFAKTADSLVVEDGRIVEPLPF